MAQIFSYAFRSKLWPYLLDIGAFLSFKAEKTSWRTSSPRPPCFSPWITRSRNGRISCAGNRDGKKRWSSPAGTSTQRYGGSCGRRDKALRVLQNILWNYHPWQFRSNPDVPVYVEPRWIVERSSCNSLHAWPNFCSVRDRGSAFRAENHSQPAATFIRTVLHFR